MNLHLTPSAAHVLSTFHEWCHPIPNTDTTDAARNSSLQVSSSNTIPIPSLDMSAPPPNYVTPPCSTTLRDDSLRTDDFETPPLCYVSSSPHSPPRHNKITRFKVRVHKPNPKYANLHTIVDLP